MPTVAPQIIRPSSARRVVLDGFVPTPLGSLATAPAALSWPAKDPGDVLDYEFDIAPALAGNDKDTIATLDVTIQPSATGDLTLASSAADGSVAVLWLAGGQAGTVYSVQVTIGTAAGRTIGRAIFLPVLALVSAAPPDSALTTADGAAVTDQSGNAITVGG
jgi:hypothetical protein